MTLGAAGKAGAAFTAAVAIVLGVPTGAWAVETIGQTGSPAPTIACDVDATYVQEAVSSGSAGYQAPVSGVITSWSTAGGSTATQLMLEVLRPNPGAGSFHYIPKQKDVLRDVVANQLNTYSGIHLPIAAGDYIGLYVPPAGANCLSFTAGSGESYHHVTGDPPLDVDAFFNNLQSSGLINASALIEPDADGDGFGDETQDGCPSSPAAQGACPTSAPPAVKKKKCKKKSHRSAVVAKKCRKKRK
jgi:hypothetical protein